MTVSVSADGLLVRSLQRAGTLPVMIRSVFVASIWGQGEEAADSRWDAGLLPIAMIVITNANKPAMKTAPYVIGSILNEVVPSHGDAN